MSSEQGPGPDEFGQPARAVEVETSRAYASGIAQRNEPTGGFFEGDKEEDLAVLRKQEEGKTESVPKLEKKKIKRIAIGAGAVFLVMVALNLFSDSKKKAPEQDKKQEDQAPTITNKNPIQDVSYDKQQELTAQANKAKGSEAATSEAMLRVHMARDGAQGELALASLSGRNQGIKDAAPSGAQAKPDPWEQARDQYRMQAASKHYQELLASRNAGLLVALASSQPAQRAGEPASPPSGASGYAQQREQAQARLDELLAAQQLRGMQPAMMQGVPGAQGASGSSGQAERKAFMNAQHAGPGVRVAMGQKVVPAGTLVSAGTLIELVLETELNSDVPGLVRGRIAAPVWDRTGQKVVVPTGSVLVGLFNARVQQGDERVQLAWTRIELPDGARIELGGQPGTELTGAAGIEADVDRHLDVVFEGALLSSLFSIGSALTSGTTSAFSQSPRQAVAGAVAGEFNETGKVLTRQGWERAPTLRVPAGTHIGIVLKEDLLL